MQYERRDFDDTPELRIEGAQTKITGYAAVFNRYSSDLGGFVERIMPGAFKRVLNRGDDILALFNHDMDNLLATRASGRLRLTEDETGLRYEFDLDSDDPDHQRVIAKVRRGDLRGSSFGFRVASGGDSWGTTEQDYPLRSISEISMLRDVGPVTAPAYPDTATIAPLALRGLADEINAPLQDLIDAGTQLRDFLIRMGEDETSTPEEPATGDTVAASPERRTPRVMPVAKWHTLAARYQAKEVSSDG